MHYHDRRRGMNISDFMSSFGTPTNVSNINRTHSSNYNYNTLVQPTAAIFQPLQSLNHPPNHHSQLHRNILAGDLNEIMKRRLLKSTTKPSNAGSNERLTLPTINRDNEAQARALDMLTNDHLAANINTFNEQYEQILSHLLNPYYSSIPASMLLFNRPPPVEQQQHVLRSHVSSVSYKSIPHTDNPVNLEGFRTKRPFDWSMEDVWSWMVSFAEQHKISADYLNMANFVNCTGMKLITLNRQQFIEMDETYGEALYNEFKKLAEADYVAFDDVMRATGFPVNRRKSPAPSRCSPSTTRSLTPSYCGANVLRSVESSTSNIPQDGRCPSSSAMTAAFCCQPSMSTASQPLPISRRRPPHHHHHSHSDQPSTSAQQFVPNYSKLAGEMLAPPSSSPCHGTGFGRDSVIKTAGCDNGPIAVPGFSSDISSALQKKLKSRQDQQTSAVFLGNFSGRSPTPLSKFAYGKICKKPKPGHDEIILTASGKPRKRSQHTKGNKLWEFIRDALKDHETCPSIVKWEDPEQGVFRIVESERLARLWGKKKNNSKMTYEKLSRAMRTYYEKKILEPVPKTGLYPKKLVYKFGPCAHGWKATPTMLPPASEMAATFNDILLAAAANNTNIRNNSLNCNTQGGGGLLGGSAGCLSVDATDLAATASAGMSPLGGVTADVAAKLNFEMAAAAALIFSQFNAAAAVSNGNAAATTASNFGGGPSSCGSQLPLRFFDCAAANVSPSGATILSRNGYFDGRSSMTSSTSDGGHQVIVDVKREIDDDDNNMAAAEDYDMNDDDKESNVFVARQE